MTERTVYVALQQFCEAGETPRRLLKEAGFQVLCNDFGRRLKREDLLKVLDGVDAVLAGVEPYDGEILSQFPRLKCISRCGVGTDSIDLAAASRQGIAILTTVDEVVEPVAQMTLGMILALARHFPEHVREMSQGVWKKRTGFLLSEWTIGLIGFGRIGRAVGRCLAPLGPKILVSDPRCRQEDLPPGVTLCSLDELLSQSDLISLHASHPKGEGPLLGRSQLLSVKPGLRLVNTARGHLVDEKALEEGLASGRIAAAALDVFEEEPYQGNLARMPQVLCTPHVSTLTRASRSAMELSCARNVIRFFNGAKS